MSPQPGRIPRRAFEAGIGPGGASTIVLVALLSAVKALALVLIAGSLATSIAALGSGSRGWEDAVLPGAIGAVLRAVAVWATAVVAARGAARAKRQLRAELGERMVRGGAEGGGMAVLATDGLDDLDEYYGTAIPAAVAALVVPVILGARLLSADWPSAIVLGLTVPLVPVFMALIGMHSRAAMDRAGGSLRRLADHVAELAHGLPVLVGLGRVAEQTEALAGIQDQYRRRTRGTLRTAFLSALALELIATLSVAVMAVMLGIRLLSGGVELEVALLVLILAPECFAALREVGAAFHSSQDGLEALRRIRSLLERTPQTVPIRPGATGVTGLTVRYPGRSVDAVAGIQLSLSPGEITSLAGPSGSGKSTILAALTGTLPDGAVTEGSIDGVDPDRIGYAPQRPVFFADTVRQELELYAGSAGGSIDALLGELGLSELAEADPAQLSPGESRRLSVARALLRVDAGAGLLLLDEPTAQLDADNAELVRRSIERHRAGAAVLLVSHDPRTLAMAGGEVGLARPAHQAAVEPATAAHSAEPAPATDPSTGGRRLLGEILAASPWRWTGGIVLGVLATGFALALAALSGWLIVQASTQPAIMYLLVAIVGVRFFGIGRAAARYAERLLTHDAVLASTDSLRLRTWAAIAAKGASSRALLGGGSAVDALVTSISRLRDLLARTLSPVIVALLALLGVVVTVAILDPVSAPAVALALTVAVVAVPGTVLVTSRRASRRMAGSRSTLVRRSFALAGAASDLRANGGSAAALESLAEAGSVQAGAERRVAWSAGLGSALAVTVATLLAVLTPGLAGRGGTSADLAAVTSLLCLAAVEPLLALAAAARGWPELTGLLGRLSRLLAPLPERAHGELIGQPIRAVALDGLTARWPGASADVFAPITARVRAGEWLVVDGPSGSGKSTLLSVLLGALDPATGRIVVDRCEFHEFSPQWWRSRVAWCPQEAHVFDSTIRGNLLLARPRGQQPSDAEMEEVLHRVGLGPLLASLPDGLATRIGSGGGSLSGGERQRLAVARALLGDADVLLLDEPTAHLDEATAAAMMADIRRAADDRIVVLVSHRIADRRPGDQVVSLAPSAQLAAADIA